LGEITVAETKLLNRHITQLTKSINQILLVNHDIFNFDFGQVSALNVFLVIFRHPKDEKE